MKATHRDEVQSLEFVNTTLFGKRVNNILYGHTCDYIKGLVMKRLSRLIQVGFVRDKPKQMTDTHKLRRRLALE